MSDELIKATVKSVLDGRETRGLNRTESVTWLGKMIRENGVSFPRGAEEGAALFSRLGFRVDRVQHGTRGFRYFISEQ